MSIIKICPINPEHGEVDLEAGCEKCIAERREKTVIEETQKVFQGDTGAVQSLLEALDLPSCIVQVRYYSQTTGEASEREYTYYSEEPLGVGDILMVPMRNTKVKAMVSAIHVPEAEIESFKEKVKSIPAGSKLVDQSPTYQSSVDPNAWRTGEEEIRVEQELPRGGLAEAAAAAGAEVTIAQASFIEDTPEPVTELAQRPGADILAHSYHVEARGLLLFAENRVITTLEDNKAASDDLTIISRLKKQMEVKKREYLDPLRDEAEAIRETYSLLMDPIFKAEKITKDKMLAYNQEQDRIRKEQEDINRKRIEAAEQEMRLKGELTESVNLIEVVPEASKRVSTELGTTGQRENWKWKVIDFALVPDEYKMINPAILTPTAKSYKDTRTIPGIEIYNEPGIATRAR